MFGMEELKTSINTFEGKVECPVEDCATMVNRIKRGITKSLDSHLERQDIGRTAEFEQYYCEKHRIYITPSTFIYESVKDNLLWYDKSRDLLDAIMKFKRVKAQMCHDNSEDAVTWNIFRFLERNNLVEMTVGSIIGATLKSSEVIYWSYSQRANSSWSELNKARQEFGEEIRRSSEPDIIVKTDNALLFIEAKLTAGNKTEPSDKSSSKKYESGGDSWFSKVFKSDYKTVAIDEMKYELLRFWLLGTWIAKHLSLDFYLVNLVRRGYEEDIESQFGRHIRQNERRKFVRIAWEDIYQYISNNNIRNLDKLTMLRYFENKTVGYKDGVLQKAFQCPVPETLT